MSIICLRDMMKPGDELGEAVPLGAAFSRFRSCSFPADHSADHERWIVSANEANLFSCTIRGLLLEFRISNTPTI